MNVETIASRAVEAASPAHLQELLDKGAKGAQTAAKAVAAYASLKSIAGAVNSLHPASFVMGALGIQRRRSVASRVAMGAGLVVAGAAVGAGVALMLTPMRGAELREAILKRLGRAADPKAAAKEGQEEARGDASAEAQGDAAPRAGASSSSAEAPKQGRARATNRTAG
ncbi:MAG: hypothetical protein U0324_14615 [Polyangiales bacterium]